MSMIPQELPEEVLQTFGAHLVVPLGGRLNRHWRVDVQNTSLVLRRWAQAADEVFYEMRLLERIAALGWPVAPVVGEPLTFAGQFWSLAPFLAGEPPSTRAPKEQRAQGRLLAEFHTDLATLRDLGQWGKWRRGETTLSPQSRPDQIVHGDFAPWNLRFQDGKLSGILDFELAHRDHRLGEFALSWRGKYDALIHGYDEVSPLEPEEWALLTPLWWAFLIECAYQLLQKDTWDDGWIISKLLQRSPLMGPDAVSYCPAR